MKSLKLLLLLLVGTTSFHLLAQVNEPLVSAVNLEVGTVKIAYYRIKQMTSDGTYNYSETTQVQLIFSNNLIVTEVTDLDATKNRGQLSIALAIAQSGELAYSIEDAEQTVLLADTQNVKIGNNQLDLDFSLFPQGEYTVKMQMGSEIDILLLEKQEDVIRLEAGIVNQKLGELIRKQ